MAKYVADNHSNQAKHKNKTVNVKPNEEITKYPGINIKVLM